MVRVGLLIGAIALTLLTGCGGGGGGGNGLTTPDGDPFGQAFRYFFGGDVFPTVPTGAEVEAGLAAERGAPDADNGFNVEWNFESYNRPEIRYNGDEDSAIDNLTIDWECTSGSCGGVVHSVADFEAIAQAAFDFLSERFGEPNDAHSTSSGFIVIWEEPGFEASLFTEDAEGGGDFGGVDVSFDPI